MSLVGQRLGKMELGGAVGGERQDQSVTRAQKNGHTARQDLGEKPKWRGAQGSWKLVSPKAAQAERKERERERAKDEGERACTKAARMTRRRLQLPAGITHSHTPTLQLCTQCGH